MPEKGIYALATTTLSGTDTEITFSGFPTDGTYRDLFLMAHFPEQASDIGCDLRLNGDSTSGNYSWMYFRNRLDNSTIQFSHSDSSDRVLLQNSGYPQATQIIDIFEYAESKYTSVTAQSRDEEYNNTSFGQYKTLSAVTSVNLYTRSGSFPSGSVVSLWGVKG